MLRQEPLLELVDPKDPLLELEDPQDPLLELVDPELPQDPLLELLDPDSTWICCCVKPEIEELLFQVALLPKNGTVKQSMSTGGTSFTRVAPESATEARRFRLNLNLILREV